MWPGRPGLNQRCRNVARDAPGTAGEEIDVYVLDRTHPGPKQGGEDIQVGVPSGRPVWRRTGLREIGWHDLRHTFCSHLAMKGAPVRAIQELAGHASIQTTQRYMHLAPSATRSAIDLLEAGSPWQQGGNTENAKT